MKIKIIILDGITVNVLADGAADVEIVSIDKDYEDYEALCKYEVELLSNESLHEIPLKVAHFGEEESN